MRVSVRILALAMILAVSACSLVSGSTRTERVPANRTSSAQEGSGSPTATAQIAVTQLPAVGRRIAFVAEDGTALLGEFFPARSRPAPAVILMHQMSASRRDWVNTGLVDWLVNPLNAEDRISPRNMNWPQLPEAVSFSVFIFDFRGHGESRGDANRRSDLLMDARAALAVVRSFPEVDPERVALVGASVGADAAVDVCVDCSGAFAFSPGSFLGVDFAERVGALGRSGIPVWCVAGARDSRSAETCLSATATTYRSLIYPNTAAHGFDLLVNGLDPEITRVLYDFLIETFDL